MSTCDVLGERLSAFLDAELGIVEHREVEAHLATCDACTERLRAWRKLDALFEPFVDEPVPFTIPAVRWRAARTFLVASVVLLLAAGAILVGAIARNGEPSDFASPGIPIPSSSRSPSASPTVGPSASRTGPGPTRPTVPSTQPPSGGGLLMRGAGGPFEASIPIDRVIDAGEPVEVRAELRNASSDAVTFDGPTESVFDLVVTDTDGNEVYRRSSADAWSGERMTRGLDAGDALTETFTITAPAEPGEYRIHVELPLEDPSFTTSPSPDGNGSEAGIEAFSTEPVNVQVR